MNKKFIIQYWFSDNKNKPITALILPHLKQPVVLDKVGMDSEFQSGRYRYRRKHKSIILNQNNE